MAAKTPKDVFGAKPGSPRANLVIHLEDYDWAVNEYRAGRPMKDIADDIGVSRSQLFDYFSKNNISMDLSTQIRNRSNRILSEDVVDMSHGIRPTNSEDIIAINATLQASLIREHRQDIRRMRHLALALLNELEHQTLNQDLYEDLGEVLRAEDERGVDKLNDVYKKVIATPGRTENLKRLAEILKITVALERQAFGMREDYEDSEIRRSRVAAISPPDEREAIEDYSKLALRFQAVLERTTDAKIIRETAAPAANPA